MRRKFKLVEREAGSQNNCIRKQESRILICNYGAVGKAFEIDQRRLCWRRRQKSSARERTGVQEIAHNRPPSALFTNSTSSQTSTSQMAVNTTATVRRSSP